MMWNQNFIYKNKSYSCFHLNSQIKKYTLKLFKK